MLIIFEGLDKSGKSTIAELTKQLTCGVLIKKQYNDELYPCNFSEASLYDWQALLDRVILANPDMTFVSDRSFITQTVYQALLGRDEHALSAKHLNMYKAYVDVVKQMPHLVVYCKNDEAYELDNMVTSLQVRKALGDAYVKAIAESGLNAVQIDLSNKTLAQAVSAVMKAIDKFCKS